MGIQQGLSRCSCQGKQPQLWKRDGEKGKKCSNPTNPGGGTHRQAPEDGLQIPVLNFPGRAPFSPAMQGQELWEGGGQHSGRVSHKPSLQQRCPSQLQTGLLAPHSQEGPSKIPGRWADRAGEMQTDRNKTWESTERPSLALSNTLSQLREKNEGEKKSPSNNQSIVSPLPGLFLSICDRKGKKKKIGVDAV